LVVIVFHLPGGVLAKEGIALLGLARALTLIQYILAPAAGTGLVVAITKIIGYSGEAGYAHHLDSTTTRFPSLMLPIGLLLQLLLATCVGTL
jgi:hypothetical protein